MYVTPFDQLSIYSQLSIAKKREIGYLQSTVISQKHVKMAIYSQLSSTVRMVICLTIREKCYFIIYHVGSARHYALGHFGIPLFMDCILKM